MSLGNSNRPFSGYRSDATSGSEFLSGNHVVYKEGGIVIDASARHAGQNPTTKMRKGCAMGRITATGKYTGFDPNGSDGTEIARGILNQDCDLAGDNGTAIDYNQAGLVIHGFYIPAKVTDEDGASVSSTVEAQRNLMGFDGSAGVEVPTGCMLQPVT